MPLIRTFGGRTIPAEYVAQFSRVIESQWLDTFRFEASRAGATTALMLAIGSRETGLRNIRGDYRDGKYHGYGVMQIDIGTDKAWCMAWTPDDALPGIKRGCEIWAKKYAQVRAGEGQALVVRGRRFEGAVLDDDQRRRVATAAYNCGLWAYYHASRNEDPDSTTTKRNYSYDVYARAVWFAALLEANSYEPDAFKREVILQGRYASADDKLAAGLPYLTPKANPWQSGEPQEPQERIEQADYDDESFIGKPVSMNPPVLNLPKIEPQPTTDDQLVKTILDRLRGLNIAIPAGAVGYAVSAWENVKSLPPPIIIGVSLLLCGMVCLYLWLRDREGQRLASLRLARERQAHELNMAQLRAAADPRWQTVNLVKGQGHES